MTEGQDASAAAPSAVRVMGLTDLPAMAHRLDSPVAVVVDATDNVDLPLTLLALLARLRRFHRVVGGELVLAACEPVAELLRRTGLLVAIPCFASIPDAVTSLDASPRRRTVPDGSPAEDGR